MPLAQVHDFLLSWREAPSFLNTRLRFSGGRSATESSLIRASHPSAAGRRPIPRPGNFAPALTIVSAGMAKLCKCKHRRIRPGPLRFCRNCRSLGSHDSASGLTAGSRLSGLTTVMKESSATCDDCRHVALSESCSSSSRSKYQCYRLPGRPNPSWIVTDEREARAGCNRGDRSHSHTDPTGPCGSWRRPGAIR